MLLSPVLRRSASCRGLYSHRARGPDSEQWRSTTILCVRKGGKVVMIGDGQVSQGYTVCKGNAIKVRKLEGGVLVGMAGNLLQLNNF